MSDKSADRITGEMTYVQNRTEYHERPSQTIEGVTPPSVDHGEDDEDRRSRKGELVDVADGENPTRDRLRRSVEALEPISGRRSAEKASEVSVRRGWVGWLGERGGKTY